MAIRNTPKERLYFAVASYFRFWANLSFQRWKPTVIAITGSTGKTTLLQLLEAQLGNEAHYSHDANSIYGISFDILGMSGVTKSRLEWLKLAIKAPFRALSYTRKTSIYVVEIDGARPGGASKLATWLKPTITAITNIEESHAEFFDDTVAKSNYHSHLEAITAEFMSLPLNTKQFILSDGDPKKIVAKALHAENNLKAEIISITKSTWLKSYKVSLDGTTYQGKNGTYQFSSPLPDDIWLQLALVEKALQILDKPIKTYDLSYLTFPPGRSNVFVGIKDTKIIDSSYNAQLGSTLAILDMFQQIKATPKWLIMGDIIELGAREADQHRTLGEYLNTHAFDEMLFIGRRLKKYTLPQITQTTHIQAFDNAHQALVYITGNLKGGETLLFKGSQHLEWLIAQLLSDPADTAKLPRQTPADYSRRQKLGYN